MWSKSIRGIAVGGAIVVGACSGRVTAPVTDGDPTVVLSVTPASNATGVSTSSPITITFSHPMTAGMELLVALHEGTIVGPPVPGSFSWSSDRTSLTFVPAENLRPGTTYVLHLSPNLQDDTGRGIDFAGCAQRVGGQSVSPGMMTGGMMGGGSGAGMMGPGWQAGAGTWGYGMSFTFTTA
ncbi:MAG TPA: Ig-like domain-containing protein [Gemmatimonadaceae bacterium]